MNAGIPASFFTARSQHRRVAAVGARKAGIEQLLPRCARTGGTAPTVMNAANEIAVVMFLGHKIGYHSIYESVAAAVEAIAPVAAPDLDVIRAADQEARAFVRSYFRF